MKSQKRNKQTKNYREETGKQKTKNVEKAKGGKQNRLEKKSETLPNRL